MKNLQVVVFVPPFKTILHQKMVRDALNTNNETHIPTMISEPFIPFLVTHMAQTIAPTPCVTNHPRLYSSSPGCSQGSSALAGRRSRQPVWTALMAFEAGGETKETPKGNQSMETKRKRLFRKWKTKRKRFHGSHFRFQGPTVSQLGSNKQKSTPRANHSWLSGTQPDSPFLSAAHSYWSSE